MSLREPPFAWPLGAHLLEVREADDGALELRLDGVCRKRRRDRGRGIWLWTNVELPFEDHHLVEVRRAAGARAVELRCNGEDVTGSTVDAPFTAGSGFLHDRTPG